MATTRGKRKPSEAGAEQPIGADLGRIAFDAYSASVGGKSVAGEQLPEWAELRRSKPDVAAAWCAAASAVITAIIERKAP